MATGFAPAGYYSDESDDDGFDFGSGKHSNAYKKDYAPVTTPTKTVETETKTFPAQNNGFSSQSRGGFGKINTPSKPIVSTTRGGDVSVEDFRAAVMKGNVEVVADHLASGINVDTVLKSGWTPLMYAASCSNTQMLQLLIDNGANVNFSNDRFSVLMASCGSNRVQECEALECVELLLKHGATVNDHDRYHMSPLIYAGREGRSTVVKLLLDSGANIDKQDSRGWTALVWASSKNNLKTVQVLLDAGADVNKMCTDGQKAADFAPENSKVSALLSGKTTQSVSTLILKNTEEEDVTMATGDPPLATTTDSTQLYVKYGDLELLLCGLQLSSLIPLFQEQKVTFADLLKMTDHDLQQLGISQLGYRKKILDGIHQVHKKDWEKTSLTSVQYNKQLSCPEAVAMLANISKHISYIGSTVAYVKGQLVRQPNILQTENDGTAVNTLFNHGEKAFENIGKVHRELANLQQELSKIKDMEEYKPPDLIKSGKTRSKYFIALTVCGAIGLFVFFFRRKQVTEVVEDTQTTVSIMYRLYKAVRWAPFL